jgi:hypothetical protein
MRSLPCLLPRLWQRLSWPTVWEQRSPRIPEDLPQLPSWSVCRRIVDTGSLLLSVYSTNPILGKQGEMKDHFSKPLISRPRDISWWPKAIGRNPASVLGYAGLISNSLLQATGKCWVGDWWGKLPSNNIKHNRSLYGGHSQVTSQFVFWHAMIHLQFLRSPAAWSQGSLWCAHPWPKLKSFGTT